MLKRRTCSIVFCSIAFVFVFFCNNMVFLYFAREFNEIKISVEFVVIAKPVKQQSLIQDKHISSYLFFFPQ